MPETKKFKFLIAEGVHEPSLNLFYDHNVELIYKPNILREELVQLLPSLNGILIRKTVFDEELVNCCDNLKFLARAGAGVDNIRVDLLNKRNIKLFTANEANRDAVAEHAIGMLLALFNKLRNGHEQLKNFVWDRESNRGLEIAGKTISIIGFGNMGSAFAQRLSGWDCTVLFYDKQPKTHSFPHVRQTDWEEISEKSDVLSLHLPLASDTKNWLDQNKIDSIKKPFWLINTARGEIADLSILRRALESGKIIGMALDVYENEPITLLSDDKKRDFMYLANHPNVLLSPHVAGWSEESYEKINIVLSKKIKQYVNTLNPSMY